MNDNSFNSPYLQELDDFYDAIDRLQRGLLETAGSVRGAELRQGIERYIEQMRDLGNRLERLFAYTNTEALRITCKSMSELAEELRELIALQRTSGTSEHNLDIEDVPSERVEHNERESLKWILGFPASIKCDRR